jgi:hypothetical protein
VLASGAGTPIPKAVPNMTSWEVLDEYANPACCFDTWGGDLPGRRRPRGSVPFYVSEPPAEPLS